MNGMRASLIKGSLPLYTFMMSEILASDCSEWCYFQHATPSDTFRELLAVRYPETSRLWRSRSRMLASRSGVSAEDQGGIPGGFSALIAIYKSRPMTDIVRIFSCWMRYGEAASVEIYGGWARYDLRKQAIGTKRKTFRFMPFTSRTLVSSGVHSLARLLLQWCLAHGRVGCETVARKKILRRSTATTLKERGSVSNPHISSNTERKRY